MITKGAKGSQKVKAVSGQNRNLAEAAKMLGKVAAAKKCWNCICLHDSLPSIERIVENTNVHGSLENELHRVQSRLAQLEHDCLGCKVCHPAAALNALTSTGGSGLVAIDACPVDKVKKQGGWPPLAGNYTVIRYRAPVAICTLTDDSLRDYLPRETGAEVAIVGSLQTENLGIERLITNILANPNIRFLIVCGADSKQAVGHLPGQSLIALVHSGINEQGHIIGANGKRPVIRNLSREAVEYFRDSIEVLDLVGSTNIKKIAETCRKCAKRNPGPNNPFDAEPVITPIKGYIRKQMQADPAGYFVVYADQAKKLISLEHYRNDGVLDTVVEGCSAAELYTPVIDHKLISRLDHGFYLGRELARAEHALKSGEEYIQDAAPEVMVQRSEAEACGCSSFR